MSEVNKAIEEKVRQLKEIIQLRIQQVRETDRAKPSLWDISLQSTINVDRHVWISVYEVGTEIDLELWDEQEEDFNVVATKLASTPDGVENIIRSWLLEEK